MGAKRSEQERILCTIYPHLPYEPRKFAYTIEAVYTPDLYLGVSSVTGRHVYVECKEYIEYTDCKRYESIADSMPRDCELRFLIFRAQERTLNRLDKRFHILVSYSDLSPWLSECVYKPTKCT